VKEFHGHNRLTGQSPALQRVLAQVEQVAPTGSTVLLQGETGTGNVRELRNAIERAMIVSSGTRLKIEHHDSGPTEAQPSQAMEEVECEHLLRVLEQTAWRIRGKKGAAGILGLKPTTLEFRMVKLGLRRPA
jgi:transcriptional regulator with GAF, ATPase, and Fis domain